MKFLLMVELDSYEKWCHCQSMISINLYSGCPWQKLENCSLLGNYHDDNSPIHLYPFIPASVTLTVVQGDSGAGKIKLKVV